MKLSCRQLVRYNRFCYFVILLVFQHIRNDYIDYHFSSMKL